MRGAEVLELVEISGQLRLIEATGRGSQRAGDVERDLHRSASHPLADVRLDPRLEYGEALAGAEGDFEEAVVDAPHLDPSGVGPFGGEPLATTGHAERHGVVIPRRVKWRKPYLVASAAGAGSAGLSPAAGAEVPPAAAASPAF